MKPLKHTYRRVDASYLAQAPHRVTVTRALPCTPLRLFEIFEDAAAWKRWMDLDVTWTSPPPVGADATRRVGLGPLTFDEQFDTWEPGVSMSFHFTRGSTGILGAFFERYAVSPTGEDCCTLTWDVGLEMRGMARVLGSAFAAGLRFNGRRSFARLAKYAEE